MTLHLLLKVMEALGSGQTSFFFWHPFCRGLLKTNQKGMNRFFNNCKVATLTVLTLYIFFFGFGVPVQVLGEQTAQQRKEEWSTEEIWLIKLFQTLVLWSTKTCRPKDTVATYQLSLTASMSLTRFWAKQIPKICNKTQIWISEQKKKKKDRNIIVTNCSLTCNNAIPINMPATTVRLSWSHFSNWGTQPFI